MADINDNTINITISAPSADSNTISVVNPALKNNVVVNDARITPSERAKLAGIEAGATADQVLTAGDNIVLSSGPDYTISLVSSPSISGNLTVAGTSDFNDSMYFSGSNLFLDRTGTISGSAQSIRKNTGNFTLTSLSGNLSMSASQDVNLTSLGGDIALDSTSGDITLESTGNAILTGKNVTVKIGLNASTRAFKVFDENGSFDQDRFVVDGRGTTTLYQALTGGLTEKLFEVKTNASSPFALEHVQIGPDSGGYKLPPSDGLQNQVLQTDGNGNVSFATLYSASGSPVPNQTNIQFLGADGNAISLDKIGIDGANDSVSINSTVSYGASGVNLFVDGGARIDGAIEVSSAGTVQYAFPTTDGTANQLLATNGSGAVTFVTPSTSNVTEGTNLYYTDARVAANSAVAANTAKTSFPGFGTTAGTALEGNTALFDGQYSSLTGVPSTFAPSAHTHTASEITDFDTEVSNNTSVAANTAKVGYTDAAVDSRIAAASIDDLSDVDTSTVAPTDGQALVWDNANSKWEPGSAGSASPWTTSGSDIYYTTGNVGIGTATPAKALDVVGEANIKDANNNVFISRDSLATVTGTYNVGIGSNSLEDLTSGNYNVGIGYFAGNNITSSTNNVSIGYATNSGVTSNSLGNNIALGNRANNQGNTAFNIAIGSEAIRYNQGSYNIGIGAESLFAQNGQFSSQNVGVGYRAIMQTGTSKEQNTGVGYYAMGDGSNNSVAVGHQAQRHNTGENNTFIGHSAGLGVSGTSTAGNTVAVGYQALTALTTGTGNTAVGYQAGDALTTGASNTLLGYSAGTSLTSNNNTILGYEAGLNTTVYGDQVYVGYRAGYGFSGDDASCVMVGSQAGGSNMGAWGVGVGTAANYSTSGYGIVGVGYQANRTNTGAYSIGIGLEAGYNSSGENSIRIGKSSGYSSTGANTIAIGADSLKVTTVDNTVAVGYQALTALTTGVQNTAVGYQAGDSIATTSYNTLFGYQAGQGYASPTGLVAIGSSTGKGSSPYSVFVGHMAGTSVTGQDNSVMGFQAMSGTGQKRYNVAIGRLALAGTGSSDSNVAIGYQALDANGNKSYNVAIGHTSGSALTTGSSNVLIGYQSGSTLTTESNKLYIENSNSTTPLIYGEFDNDILRVNGTLEPTKGVVNEGGSGFASTGDYGSGAEITYLGSSSTSTFVGRVYYYDGTTWQAFSSSTEAAQKALLGIALGSTMASGFLLKGFIQPDGASITAAQQVFGATNAAITGTAPTSGYQRVMGHAVSSTVIHFNPSQEYIDLV